MLNKFFSKLTKSIFKLILPSISKLFLKLRVNRRAINYLENESYFSNNKYNFSEIIKKYLGKDKIISLDVGAQDGFNTDNFFPSRYNNFFKCVFIEPIKSEAEKIIDKNDVISKGLWSEISTKKLYVMDNRLGSSSMFFPDEKKFDIHKIEKKEFEKFKVTRSLDVECDTISNLLNDLNIENLDFLKIDTQGAEFDILKGIGEYKPLLIKLEAHTFSMYKNVPSWDKLISFLYDRNYVVIDWKGIGKHSTRIPAELDMLFIPNFDTEEGKKLILKFKEKFVSILLIFGQLSILKIIMARFSIKDDEIEKIEDLYFS